MESTYAYRSVVGNLLYLSTHTRLDISFAAGIFIRSVASPTRLYWKAWKRILRYFPGILRLGFTVGSTTQTLLQV